MGRTDKHTHIDLSIPHSRKNVKTLGWDHTAAKTKHFHGSIIILKVGFITHVDRMEVHHPFNLGVALLLQSPPRMLIHLRPVWMAQSTVLPERALSSCPVIEKYLQRQLNVYCASSKILSRSRIFMPRSSSAYAEEETRGDSRALFLYIKSARHLCSEVPSFLACLTEPTHKLSRGRRLDNKRAYLLFIPGF